jgi:serine protease Do
MDFNDNDTRDIKNENADTEQQPAPANEPVVMEQQQAPANESIVTGQQADLGSADFVMVDAQPQDSSSRMASGQQNVRLPGEQLPDGRQSGQQQGGGQIGQQYKIQAFYTENVKKAKQKRVGVGQLILVAVMSSLLGAGLMFAAIMILSPVVRPVVNGLFGIEEKAAEVSGENGIYKKIEITQTSSPVEAIAEKVSPSIVGIKITVQRQGVNFFFNIGQEGEGYASGIIIREDGYILTNNHVIEGAMEANTNRLSKGAKIEVILPSNKDKLYTAEIIGRDSNTDIAVLKIDAKNLPVAELGDSNEVKPGELAVAIGNPGGIEYMSSVTAGVISGVNRTLLLDGREFKLIQTDAAINPGNSGGALVNSRGQVIGINTVKIASMDVEGIGFAIPINEASTIAESLIEHGYVKGVPYLGVVIDRSFTEADAESLGVPFGLLVYDVQPLTAAYKAGIHTGDIILKFDGVKVTTFDELEKQKNMHKPGDEVTVEVYRDGETLELKVVLGENIPSR